MKMCSKCAITKPPEDFPLCEGRWRAGECKVCKNSRSKTYKESGGSSVPALAEKTCLGCGLTKPITSFTRQKDQRDGFKNRCRECIAVLPSRSADYRHQEKTKAAARQGRVLVRRGPQGDAAQRRDQRREQRALISPKFLTEMKRWLHPNTPSGLAYRIRYRTDPAFREKEIVRRWAKKVRERNIPGDGTLTTEARLGLFAAARICAYCERPMRSGDKTLDHIIPWTRGGLDSIKNALICCKSCNSSKQDKTQKEWVESGNPKAIAFAVRIIRRFAAAYPGPIDSPTRVTR